MRIPATRALIDDSEIETDVAAALEAVLDGRGMPLRATVAQESDLERGIQRMEQGRLAAAEARLGRFLASSPEDVEGRSTSGVCLTRIGEPDRARAARCLERALDLRPDHDAARRALRTLLRI
jgi:Flp pilus assembly protein TadD